MRRGVKSLVFGALGALLAYCGGSTSGPASPCTPGLVSACPGPGGCSGSQVCKSDGTFDTCNCVGGDAAAGEAGASDAAGDAPVSNDGAAWSPKDLAGLVLWLDAAKGVVMDPQAPTFVLKWLDQSGHGNDAQCANGAHHAVVDPAAVHGLDAIQCLPGSLYIPYTPGLSLGGGDFGIALVIRIESDPAIYPGDDVLLGQFDDPITQGIGIRTFQGQTPQLLDLPFVAGVPSGTTKYFDKFEIVTARGPSSLELRIGADLYKGPNAAGGSGVAAGLQLCSNNSGGPNRPELAEAMLILSTVSDADLANITSYLGAKYGL